MSKRSGIVGIGIVGVFAALLLFGLRLGQNPESAEQLSAGSIEDKESSASFEEWMAEPGQELEKGIALAKERGVMMRELIRTNPEQAIQKALSLSEWSSLPSDIQALVEQPFSALANVEVLISCSDEFSETGITTEFQNTGKMETFVYGRRGEVGSKTGLPVQGIRVGNIGALREELFQSLDAADEAAALQLYPVALADPGGDSVAALAGGKLFYFKNSTALDEANTRLAALEELPGPNAGAQALFQSLDADLWDQSGINFRALEEIAYAESLAWTGTPRDMYVIMVDFSDLAGQPTDPAALSNSINTTISQQIWDMSYEKTHIVGIVNPTTYRVAGVSSSYIDTLGSYPNAGALHTEAKALAEADGVDLSPYETICVFFKYIAGMGYSGLGSVGGSRMWINGTTSAKIITHELGHNYGAKHSDTWLPTNNDPVDPAGSEVGYGDFTDLMGSGSLPSGHFNAMHKKRLGWLESQNWLRVSTSGSYRVYRSDHRQTTGILRGLEIEKSAGDEYWVGLRQEQTSYETFSRGAYILWKMSGDNESDLLDMTPASVDGKYDGGLALGQTYSDATAAVHITPTERGGQSPNEWMDITVNLGSFGGNSAPTASLSGPSNLAVQAAALFSVTASDVDGDELAYFWDTGDGLIKPNAPTIAATWLSGSTVNVSCVISDMKGGTNKVSQTVVLSSPLDNWTQRTSGTASDLNDIKDGDGLLVAVGNSGIVISSTNGIAWTVIDAGNPYFEGVIYDGSMFIAVGMDYDFDDSTWKGTVFTSINGTSWTRRYLDGVNFNDVAYGGGFYIAVGDDGSIIRSTNGLNWTTVVSGVSTDLQGISYGDGSFVIVGDEGGTTAHVVLTSTNGISWTDVSSGSGSTDNQWMFEVEYLNGRFLAGGGFRSGIQYSTDQGQTFAVGADDDYEIDGFAYGGGIYLATGVYSFTGRSEDINLISADGVNWSELSTGQKDNQNAAVAFSGTFITVGDNGSIWQSDAAGASTSGYATWQLANGGVLGFNRDPLDDADFDGHLNLEEYAMGSSASDADSIPSEYAGVHLGTYFQASYERDGIKADIDYQVERASNLVSNDWSSANTVTLEDSATNLTVRSAHTISSQTNEFLRLKVELK